MNDAAKRRLPPRATLAALVALSGCADVALEPESVPTRLAITPQDTLVVEGRPAKLTLQVFDQDDRPMRGPPSWAPADWRASEADAVEIGWDGSLTTLKGADVRVVAKTAGLETWTRLRVNPVSVTLSVGAVYVNQVIQNARAGVPIVAGRPGVLRVFLTGDEVSFYEPRARAEFVAAGRVVHAATLDASSDVLPADVQEGRLDRSFNAAVPGEVLQPGVGLVLELDVDGAVPKAPGTETRFPAEGVMPLDVIAMPTLRQVFVPVLLRSNADERALAAVLNWIRGAGPDGENSEMARKLLPVNEMEVTVQEPYTTTANLRVQSGWDRLLRQMHAKWQLEGREGYYYGVLQNGSGFLWGGYAYIGLPVSVGVTRNAIYAHELGHNMDLSHAPCGGAAGPDPQYPYDGGGIGQWGYDVARNALIDPRQYKDLMGYCRPDWVSDYQFLRAMRFRLETERDLLAPPPPAERTLMLWGGARDGELQLEPAFLLDAPVSLPTEDGPYRLQGFGPDGGERFSLSFSPMPMEFGGGGFHFHVPYDPGRDGALERVALSGPEGHVELTHGGAATMAILRDRESGRIRAMLDDWSGGLNRVAGDVEALVSAGLPGELR